MSEASLVGRSGTLVVSEPWDISGEGDGTHLSVCVKDVHSRSVSGEPERLLLALDSPVLYRQLTIRFLVLSPRDPNGVIADLLQGTSLESVAVGVTDDMASQEAPWGADEWRGGLGIVGNLRLE